MSELDRVARQAIIDAWPEVVAGRQPTLAEIYAVQVTGRAESYYGRGWHSPPHAPDAVTSRNWGAVQCTEHSAQFYRVLGATRETLENHPVPSAVEGHCFLGLDSSPSKGWYHHPYRWYATDREGCKSVLSLLEKRGVLARVRETPTLEECATAQYDTGYFEGVHRERERNIADRVHQFRQQAEAIAEACGDGTPGLVLASELGGAAPPGEPFPTGGDTHAADGAPGTLPAGGTGSGSGVNRPGAPPTQMTTHTVRSGDTPWNLALTYAGSGKRYPELGLANPRLCNRDGRLRMWVGDVLTLPAAWLAAPSAPSEPIPPEGDPPPPTDPSNPCPVPPGPVPPCGGDLDACPWARQFGRTLATVADGVAQCLTLVTQLTAEFTVLKAEVELAKAAIGKAAE